jgi:hypothetical protein
MSSSEHGNKQASSVKGGKYFDMKDTVSSNSSVLALGKLSLNKQIQIAPKAKRNLGRFSRKWRCQLHVFKSIQNEMW